MSIPFFSYIYIFILCKILLFSPSFKCAYASNVAILFFIELVYNQGYFIKIGTSEFTLQFVQSTIIFLFSVIYIVLQYKHNDKVLISLIVFLMMPLLSILLQFILPYSGDILPTSSGTGSWDEYVLGHVSMCKYKFETMPYVVNYLKIIIYGMMIYVMKMIFVPTDIYALLTRIIRWSLVVVIYGYIEMIMKNFLLMPQEAYKFTEFLFGVSEATYSWQNAIVMADGWYKLQGFTREPSHYVISLFIFSLLILIAIKYQKNTKVPTPKYYYVELALVGIILPLTGGMSSIWCIVSLIFVYMILYMDRNVSFAKILKGVCTLFFVTVVIGICIYYLLNSSDAILIERFSRALDTASVLAVSQNVIFLTGMDVSTLARFTSTIVCLDIWLDNPLLGLGKGIMSAHDFTATMLVNIGLLGCASWYYYLTSCFYGKGKYDHFLLITLLLIIFLPIGPNGGWFMFLYFFLIVEATALYMR